MKVIDLGWCMARLDTAQNKLVIVSPSDEYSLASSILIYRREDLIALRDMLNEAFPEGS